MESASRYAFIKPQLYGKSKNLIPQALDEEEDIDTNVISVFFSDIQESMKKLRMGDPIFCKKCSASLSALSNVYTKEKYLTQFLSKNDVIIEEEPQEETKNDQSQKIEPKKGTIPASDIKSHESIWVCEFCSLHNKISIEAEELPKTDDLFYMLQSATQQQMQTTTPTDEDITLIFCIDFSGSMCVSTEIQVKEELRYGVSKEEWDMLKDFIEDNAPQFLPNQNKATQWVSRKQCVLAAIENQLEEIKKTHPNRKVGVVAFNNEVIAYGDGSSDPEIITGDKLNNKDICLNIGLEKYESLISSTITDSGKRLINKLASLKETGKTALGPALAVSLGLASKGKPGSSVILCTDGLANVGVGELDSVKSDVDQFYEEMGQYAKERGIMVNIITIKGEGCRVDRLGTIADMTQGKVTRVNPDNIAKDFANVMKDEAVATQVKVRVRLHPSLTFRRENKENVFENGSLCLREIGNVTAKTALTFEYQAKSDVELAKEGLDLEKLEEFPMQAHVYFTSQEGHKMLRTITMKLKSTKDLQAAQKGANVRVLATRAAQFTSEQASKGDVVLARKVNKKWDQYMNEDVAFSNVNDVEYNEGLGAWNENQRVLKKEVDKKIKRGQVKGFFGQVAEKFNFKSQTEAKEFEEEARNLSEGSDDEGEAQFFAQKQINFKK